MPRPYVRVLDGDTFTDSAGITVRLLAIDTPEKGEPFYREATEALEEILSYGRLNYRYGSEREDRYGRLLAFVFADTFFVNEQLVARGLARVYYFRDQTARSELGERLCDAQRDAVARRVGIWSLSIAPESRYFGNPRSRRFHRPSCRSLNRSDTLKLLRVTDRWTLLELCYSPCRDCKP